ncbi:MAG: ketopantoate reductase family protein [Solirubrobacteraceae bacterium]
MIAVLGPGGVGGLLAAALERAGTPVVLVAREETAAQLGELHVRSVALGDFTASPRVVSRLREPVRALIVATKAVGLREALARIEVEPELVLPLLNGLDHMEVLREYFPRVLAGSIRVESDRPSPGEIVQTSSFLRIELAGHGGDWLARTLSDAGVPAVVRGSEAQVLWSKLVRLNALACTTSASGLLLGPIRADPHWRRRLERAVAEAAAVARASGAEVDPARVIEELTQAHATLGSSMARDLAAGRPAEVDAIPGAVLRAAAKHGIACPEIEALRRDIVSSSN